MYPAAYGDRSLLPRPLPPMWRYMRHVLDSQEKARLSQRGPRGCLLLSCMRRTPLHTWDLTALDLCCLTSTSFGSPRPHPHTSHTRLSFPPTRDSAVPPGFSWLYTNLLAQEAKSVHAPQTWRSPYARISSVVKLEHCMISVSIPYVLSSLRTLTLSVWADPSQTPRLSAR